MSRLAIILALFFLPIKGFGQCPVLFQKPSNTGDIGKKYSRKEVSDDIRFMLRITKQAHVNFYHNFTGLELERTINDILQSLPDSISIFQASLAIGKIEAMFNEGHLGWVKNAEIIGHINTAECKFPVSLFTVTDSTLIVSDDSSALPELQANDTIFAVNSIPASTLVHNFKQYFGGIDEWRRHQVAEYFPYLMFCADIRPPYLIRYKRNGETFEHLAEGQEKTRPILSENQVLRPTEMKTVRQNVNFNYAIKGRNIAYIDFFSMADLKSFKDSLKATFHDIRSRNIQTMIVDLRDNGGGDSRLSDHFLSYVTRKPYRLQASLTTRVSRPLKQYNRLKDLPWYSKFGWLLIPPGISWTSNIKSTTHHKSEPFFDGDVVYLIGNGTFSAANILANAVKDFRLGLLVGESTAEPCNEYSDMLNFMLPNTRLVARSSLKYYVRANGDKNNKEGVAPDFLIKPSGSDLSNRKDVVLDFAIKLLERTETSAQNLPEVK